jgi:hypothetical protein
LVRNIRHVLIHPEQHILSGAMLVAICMPCWRKRWFLFTFGVLADGNTCRFLCLLYKEGSWRLSLEWVLIAFHQTLTDDKTGISVGIALHATLRTEGQWSAGGIAFCWLACLIPSDKRMTTGTCSARIPRVDSGRDDPLIPCLVFGVREDASLHPEGPFAIASSAVLAPGRFETAKVLKHEDLCPMLFSKLDNASAHQMRKGVIYVVDLAPKGDVVLFAFRENTSLAPVACDPS